MRRAANVEWVVFALVGFAFVAGFVANMERRAHVSTRIVKVEKSWGTPSQSIPGEQVNANLAGATCDWYAAKKTLVCHA